MLYSIIKKSQLEGAKRLDAEYYQPEYLDYLKKIKKNSFSRIGQLAKVLRGITPKEYSTSGNYVVRSGDLSDFFISDSLLRIEGDRLFYLVKDDILISSIGFGSIGKVNLFEGSINKVATVSEITIIRDPEISPYFLWAFLRSKFGQFQINREITGATGQLHLNTENVKNIIIPLFDNDQVEHIDDIFSNAAKLYKNSKALYQQAEALLLKELGLEKFGGQNDSLFTIINLSEAKTAVRLDAEYFNSDVNKLIDKIKKISKPLGELVDIKKGIEPGAEEYLETGKQFIRVSSLSKYGINDSDQKYLSEELYQKLKGDFQPKKGEILLTKDASPGVTYVLKEDMDGIVSGGILRLKIKDKSVEDEYLSLCLNSVIGQMQAERDAGGSVIKHWKPEQIKQVMIPILPKIIQEKISSLIRESFTARKKAKELLDEAKRRVEEMIEKGGDK